MNTQYTVPASMSSLTDDRPLVKVVVDVHETMSLLTAGLMEISPDKLIDDHTVRYIGGLIVESVASPYPQPRAISQVGAFFPTVEGQQIEKLVDEVKQSFSNELHLTEMATEGILGQPIYPAKDMRTVMASAGQTITLPYRLGRESDDPLIDNPDIGYSPAEVAEMDVLDEELSESIIHLD